MPAIAATITKELPSSGSKPIDFRAGGFAANRFPDGRLDGMDIGKLVHSVALLIELNVESLLLAEDCLLVGFYEGPLARKQKHTRNKSTAIIDSVQLCGSTWIETSCISKRSANRISSLSAIS